MSAIAKPQYHPMARRRGASPGIPTARLASAPPGSATPRTGSDGGYPWSDGELLYAADLNAAIASSATVYDIRAYGAKSDGATDDSAALNAAIVAAIAAGGGKVIISAGRTALSSEIAANIPAGVTLTIEGMGFGLSELFFSAPTDGLDFTMLNSGAAWGGVHLRDFTLTRGPTSPANANTGISLSIPSGSMYTGASSLRDLKVQGSGGAALTNQWATSVLLAGVGGITVDNVSILGQNAGAADRGDVLMSITGGPGTGQYAASYAVSNCYLQGGSCGVSISGYVQGVFIANSTVIGQYDSIRWVSAPVFGAEELAVTNSTLNGAHRGFYTSVVNQCAVSNTTILHFNVGAANFAGVEINQGGFNSIVGNNIIGINAGTENGIILSDCGMSPNSVVGNIASNIVGAGIWMKGTTAITTVSGNVVFGGGIVQDTQGNVIIGNMWNTSAAAISGPVSLTVPAGTANVIQFQTADVTRWYVGADQTAESGGNAGSNFEFIACSDSGSPLGYPLTINRASGAVTINGIGSGDMKVSINGAVGSNRVLQFETGGVPRWFLGVNNTAEAGSNAGTDFELLAINDAGSSITTALTVKRSTGVTTFAAPPVLAVLASAANDAAAATAGVSVGQLYRNGSALQVRVT